MIETERLILRRLSAADADDIFNTWTNDPAVSKYMTWNTSESVDDTLKWLVAAESEKYEFGIVLKSENKLIGSTGAHLEKDGIYETGYCLARAYWGHGYATEALKALMDYLINNEGLKRFSCKHVVENTASGNVMQKAGFVYKTRAMFKSIDGKRDMDCYVYELLVP